jgi:MFS family permease
VAEGVNSLLKVISGYWSDRARRRRPIVIAGYALSSLARPFIAITTTWPQVLLIRALDRVGKGIRGAPRDVLLARFATPTTRGRSMVSIARWITPALSSVHSWRRSSSSSRRIVIVCCSR